jgi:hypothetical protein
MSPLPPACVVGDHLRRPRLSLPHGNLRALRTIVRLADINVLVRAEALVALGQESYGNKALLVDQRRVLAFFQAWKDLGRPIGVEDLFGDFVDLLDSLVVE